MASELATILASLTSAIDQQLHPDDNDFVGRAYVRDEIAKFLAVRNRMFVQVGPPGIGKTALAAQLVRENMAADTPYLAHFCSLSGDDNPYTFCDALAQQLDTVQRPLHGLEAASALLLLTILGDAARLDLVLDHLEEVAGVRRHCEAEEAGQHIVSVRFQGQAVEEKGAAPVDFNEVWHLVKPVDDSRSWAIAGIEQSH